MNLATTISHSKKKLILLIPYILLNFLANAQCRGTQPGELYFSLAWYYDSGSDTYFSMIARTTDYGQHLDMLYLYETGSPEMPVGWILADAMPDVLYNQLEEGLYRSFNNAQTWEFIDEHTGEYSTGYTTGSIENEIFKVNSGILEKSSDNGSTWIQKQTDIIGRIEVGYQSGELYVIEAYDNDPYDITLHHSINDGVDYNSYIVDPEITGYKISGSYPHISRGTILGEIYLVTWWPPANYKIFRSTDYGETFTLQYEQPDTCYFWDESYKFTAGREDCEFYILKIKTWIDGYYNRLHIYYSNDCAQSFTEYVHVLDENWADIPDEKQTDNFPVSNFPNPCKGQTTFYIPEYGKYNNPAIEIFNVQGRKVKELQIDQNQIYLNATELPSGTYFYRLRTEQGCSGTNKIIIIK